MPRAFALAILAAALLLRLLVPQGWMPADTGHGWQLVMCSGSGPMPMSMAPGMRMTGQHHMPTGPDHGAGEHACPYASLAMALEEPVLPVVALPTIARSVRRVVAAHSVTVGRGLAAPPPPATGPPIV